MKFVQLNKIGNPEDSVSCEETEVAPAPLADQVTIRVDAFPINPADLLFIEGRYAEVPSTPTAMGAESVASVSAVGENVTDLAVGDRVMHMGRENWMQVKTVARAALIKMPQDVDPLQLAMLKVNPPTAKLLITAYVDLEPGEWLIQSAANSAVGTYIIRLAKQMGLRTVNIVRRDDVVDSLLAYGADVVLVDGPDLAERVKAATKSAKIRLGIDAVAGDMVQRLADVMASGGTIVNYGMLSNQHCSMNPNTIVFKDISLRGFWLLLHLQKMKRPGIEALYASLAAQIKMGALNSEIEATYAIEDIKAAVAHAGRRGRSGKILVTPNGLPSG